MVFGVMLVGGMIAGGVIAGGVVGHYATKNRYASMAREQEQQEQLQRVRHKQSRLNARHRPESYRQCKQRLMDLMRTKMMLFRNLKN